MDTKDVTASDVTASDVTASDVTASDVTASDVTASDVTASDVTASDVVSTAIESVERGITAVANKIGDVANLYGPDVLELILAVARIDALSTLVLAIIGTILLLSPVYIMTRKTYIDFWRKTENKGGDGLFLLWVASILTSAITTILSIAVFQFWRIFDVWVYAGIIYPELWIAKKALDAAT